MDVSSIRETGKIRVLVADYSRIHTQLMSDALERDPNLQVVHWDGNRSTLVSVAVAQAVNVIAISSALNGQLNDSLGLIRQLRAAAPGAKVVVLLDSHNKDDVINVFRAGARGIFSRDGSVEMLRKCMSRVHQGEIWADTWGVSLAIDALAAAPVLRTVAKNGVSLLSKRELEVVKCLVQGMTNRQIADQMGLSQHTIKNYLFRVFDKLGVSSRTELLFMTLGQEAESGASVIKELATKIFEGHLDDETLAICEKAAADGVSSAQLALAQMYLAGRARPEDVVQAYMWYLVAAERWSQNRGLLEGRLSPKQVQEAQQRAKALIARMNGKAPAAQVDSVGEYVSRAASEKAAR